LHAARAGTLGRLLHELGYLLAADPARLLAQLPSVTGQPVRGRRRALGFYRAVVLTLFLMRRNEAQAVAAELFGRSQSTVSRVVRRLRQVTADFAHRRAGNGAFSRRRYGGVDVEDLGGAAVE
jgi:hypothetical protein